MTKSTYPEGPPIGTYASVVGTYSFGEERAAAAADTPLVDTQTAAVTGVVYVPHLLGTSYYDQTFLDTRFQRSIGLGVTYAVKRCDDPDATCADGVLKDRLLGLVVDFRLSSALTPRVVVGRRTIEREGDTEEVPQVGVQFALSISKSSS